MQIKMKVEPLLKKKNYIYFFIGSEKINRFRVSSRGMPAPEQRKIPQMNNSLRKQFELYKANNASTKSYILLNSQIQQLKKQYKQLSNRHSQLKDEFNILNRAFNQSKTEAPKKIFDTSKLCSGPLFSAIFPTNNDSNHEKLNKDSSTVIRSQPSNQKDTISLKEIKQSMSKMHEDLTKKNSELSRTVQNHFKDFSNGMILQFKKLSIQIANISKQKNQITFGQAPYYHQYNHGNSAGMPAVSMNRSNSYSPTFSQPFYPTSTLNNNLSMSLPPNTSLLQSIKPQSMGQNLVNNNKQTQANLNNFASSRSSQSLIGNFCEQHSGYKVTYRKNQNGYIVDFCIQNQFGMIQVLDKMNMFTKPSQICEQVDIIKDCCTVNDPSLEKYHIRLTSYNFMGYQNKSFFEKGEIHQKVKNISFQDDLNAHIEEKTGNLVIEMKPKLIKM